MGNSSTPMRPELQYVRTVDDEKFGRVELYRRNQMEYIMKKSFTFVNQDSMTERVRMAISFMETHKHVGLPTVHHITRITCTEKQQLCIQYDKVEMYVDYYNYTFDSIIKGGKQVQQPQLWYALSVLSELGHLLKINNMPCSPFHLDQIFITLKGTPSIYVCECLANEEQTNFEEDIAKIILSLAQLKKVQTVECGEINKINPLLRELLEQMVSKKVSLKEVHDKIEEYAGTNRIKIANNMRLSKFKALIPPIQREPSREVLKISRRSVARSQKADSTLNSTQRSSHQQKPRPIAIECLKQLQERKLQNQIKQKMMKQRMQQLLGKQNLSINRTVVSSSANKAPMKRPPTANTSAFNRNSASKK